MNEIVLSCRGLSKTYVSGPLIVPVLLGIDLDVRRGESIAIIGASGSGKSTLLHLLGGLDSPTAGEIWFEGRNLATLSEAQLAQFRNAKVGFVFQAYHLLPELDAVENVCLPARMAREPAGIVARRARELLGRVGLGDRTDHRPFELSGGEQQRVAIARALIRNPALLLADEPTGNLDSHTGQGIIDLLCELRAEGNTTLIIATHDTKVAARAPRVIELVDGQVAAGRG